MSHLFLFLFAPHLQPPRRNRNRIRKSVNEAIMMPIGTGRTQPWSLFLALAFCLLLFSAGVEASVGDRLPEFRECVEVGYIFYI